MRRFDFDLIVVGGGSAGLVSAYYARGLGKKVLLVSDCKPASKFRHDIPLKMFVDAARNSFLSGQPFDQSAHRVYVKNLVKSLSAHATADQIRTSGIEVAGGYGKFVDPHTIRTGKRQFSAANIIIATGSVPLEPQIEGLQCHVISPDKFLELDQLPSKIAVIGGGPAGVQFARAIAYAGKKVVLIERHGHILPREDQEIAAKLSEMYMSEHIHLLCGANISSIQSEQNKKILSCHTEGKKHTISVDAIVLCAGRRPNTDKLSLDAAGLKDSAVSRSLQSGVAHIYFAGDAAGPWFMSSIAEERGACAAANALGSVKSYPRYEQTLWHTFSSPDVARCGLTEHEAFARFGKRSLLVYRFPFVYSLGAQIEKRGAGFAKFICKKNGQIVGAHIIDRDAVSLIAPVHTARALHIPFSKLSTVPHHFPGLADVYKQPARRCYVDTINTNPFVTLFQILLPHKR